MRFRKYYSHYRTLLSLGLPIAIGQLGMIVMSFADTIMVGRHGTDELAAASVVNNILNLAIIFSTGFSYGLTPVVGGLFGQHRHREIGTALKSGLIANTAVALLLSAILGIIYSNLHRMGQPAELIPLMRPYFLILLSSLVFVLLFNGFKQFADGIMDTRTSMWILLTGNLINILGNWILIYGKLGMPEMGLLGAGIATLAARICVVVIFAAIFFKSRHYREYRQGFLQQAIRKEDFVQLNRLGWPVALQMGMETASFSLSAIMVGWLGTKALAAHQIMSTISQLGFMMYYGMAAAVAIRASYFMGQKDLHNVKSSAKAGFHIIMVIAVAVSVFLYLYGAKIAGLFTPDTRVQLLAAQLVIPFVLYQFGDGLQCTYSNALRGISDVKPVMVSAFIAFFIISLPSGYFFGFILDMGLTGIWLSYTFGLTTAGVLYYLRFRYQTRRMGRLRNGAAD